MAFNRGRPAKSRDIIPFSSDEKVSSELVDYRFLITQQIYACQKYLTTARTEVGLLAAQKAIDVFEMMVTSCHIDEEFKKDIKRINTKHKVKFKKLNEQEKDVFKKILSHGYLLARWKAILSLASRIGFTHIQKTKILIK